MYVCMYVCIVDLSVGKQTLRKAHRRNIKKEKFRSLVCLLFHQYAIYIYIYIYYLELNRTELLSFPSRLSIMARSPLSVNSSLDCRVIVERIALSLQTLLTHRMEHCSLRHLLYCVQAVDLSRWGFCFVVYRFALVFLSFFLFRLH